MDHPFMLAGKVCVCYTVKSPSTTAYEEANLRGGIWVGIHFHSVAPAFVFRWRTRAWQIEQELGQKGTQSML